MLKSLYRSSAHSLRHFASPVRWLTWTVRKSGSMAWLAYLYGCLRCADTSLPTQVTDVFKLEDYQLALDKMNSRGALKIAIKP